jgi:hypothetical protein
MLLISKLCTFKENSQYTVTVNLVDQNDYELIKWTQGKISNNLIHAAYLESLLLQSVAYLNEYCFKSKKFISGEKLITCLQDWLSCYALLIATNHDTRSLTNYFIVKESLWEQFKPHLAEK